MRTLLLPGLLLPLPLLLLLSGPVSPQSPPAPAAIRFIPPPPPYTGEPSGRARGGGSRSPGCDRYQDLTVLVPTVQVGDRTLTWGLTTAAHPTFWIAAPTGLDPNTPIELVLRDSSDRQIYQAVQNTVATPPGSFRISLSPFAPALQEGELYHWTLSIFCDPEIPDVPLQLEGYVQRVSIPASLTTPPTPNPDLLLPATQLAAAGIWYDALTVLGNQYEQTPSPAIAAAWSSLLEQVSLERSPHLPSGSCCR